MSPPIAAAAATPARAAGGSAADAPAAAPFDAAAELDLELETGTRWMGWRLRLLVVAALIGSLGLFLLVRALAGGPTIDVMLQAAPHGPPVLVDSPIAELQPYLGRPLAALEPIDGSAPIAADELLLRRSARWQIDDTTRARQIATQQRLADALATGAVTLRFADGEGVTVRASTRGFTGLGLVFWPLVALALVLYLVAVIGVLVRAGLPNLLYALMALAQAGNLLCIAIEAMRGLGLPPVVAAGDLLPRAALDLVAAAATVHVFALHPRRLPRAFAIGAAAWTSAALLLALMHSGLLPQLWWWAQGGTLALGAAALVVIRHSQRIAPTPFAVVVRRFGIVALGTFALVTFAAAAAAGEPGVPLAVVAFGSIVWYLFYASLLLLVPFLAKSRQVLREFALVAGISTVATSLDLLFVAVLSLGQFMSLALALFLSLGIYAGAREWIVRQLVGAAVPTTERTFEQLYRAARAVQEQPGRHADALAQLLRELYEPLELQAVGRRAAESQVYGGGASMLVPLRSADDALPVPPALALRYARRGKRLFTDDDARLADRVVEQFRRAVAYDLAVERGRAEERLRIAQDLHDDIGARLLTLMYQAQSPEMEEYIRHTLQDLKTLTRGLATAEHRLSHAAAEWKADLAQRLAAAHIDLEWSLEFDVDLRLDVVTWSALTRVLRELASNVIAHAQASRMDVTLSVVARGLRLVVADDGRGREPQAWSHGLGLGGIRKRVKLLGGEVRWREQTPRGIACEVRVVDLGARR